MNERQLDLSNGRKTENIYEWDERDPILDFCLALTDENKLIYKNKCWCQTSLFIHHHH